MFRTTIFTAAATALFAFAGPASAGLAFNGLATNGLATNGLAFNGLAFNGLAFNGLAFNGLAFNGTDLAGTSGQVHRRVRTDMSAAPAIASVRLADGTVVTVR